MDLGFLKPLYDSPPDGRGACFASVYMDITRSTESAAKEVELRWRSARERLAADGADEATLDAAEQAIGQPRPGARGLAVFARDGAVRLSGTLPHPPLKEIARYAPLPHVVPWLAQRPRHLPHVRVAASHGGGRLLAVSAAAGTPRTTEVEGQSWPVHKVSTGGWAERRLQRAAEETWAENAKRIAEAAAAAAQDVHAEFALVGGDVRERSAVVDLLPVALRERAVIVDREVAPDDAAFEDAARAEVARRAELADRARLDDFRVRMTGTDPGSHRAVEGLGDTLTALRDGLASDVLLADETCLAATAWIGPGMAEAAVDARQLDARADAWPRQDRADAAIARSIAGTGASLHFLPTDTNPPRDGVAALLRAPLAAL